jgi:hypothetical protein
VAIISSIGKVMLLHRYHMLTKKSQPNRDSIENGVKSEAPKKAVR